MNKSMLAGRLDLTTLRFAVEEIPIPEPADDEVRIAVRAAGVCLSDLHLIDGSLTTSGGPREVTLGHEVAGTVEALGANVPPGVSIGQRVTLQAGQSCGSCEGCRRLRPCRQSRVRGVHYDGGWAEYALARHDTLVPIPGNLPFDQAAIIPDAVSTPYAAVVATAGVRSAQAVGVWGAGGLGVHGLQVLRHVGAAPIIAIDPLPGARQRALSFGADLVLDPSAHDFADQISVVTNGRGLDFAFDFAGVAPVREQAAAVLAPGGALVLVGLTSAPLTVPNGTAFSVAGHRLLGHFGSSAQHVEDLVALAGHHRLDFSKSISGHFDLSDAEAAIRQLADKIGDPIRLVLIP